MTGARQMPATPVPSSFLCLRLRSDGGQQHHFTTVVAEALLPEASSVSVALFVITVAAGVPAFTFTENAITLVWYAPIVPVHSMLFVAALKYLPLR